MAKSSLLGSFDPILPTQLLPYIIAALALLIFVSFKSITCKSDIPLVNAPNWFQPRIFKQLHFMSHSLDEISKAREASHGKPFRLLMSGGETIVLPPHFAHTIRNDSRFSLHKLTFNVDGPGLCNPESVVADYVQEFHANLPGFQPFGLAYENPQLVQRVLRNGLTKHLSALTEPLTSETIFAAELVFGNSAEWRETLICESVLDIIARLTTRIFLGGEICRDEGWLKLTKEYAVHGFIAAFKLTMIPRPFKYIFQWFSTDCRKVRRNVKEASKIINPLVNKRRALKSQARAEGKPEPLFNDLIDWATKESNGQPYDSTTLQLGLSVASIHGTTDLCTNVLVLLASNPEFIEPLRQEMIDILRADGWTKNALYNLKLLDSTLKEAQRVKPAELLTMRRMTLDDVHFADGLRIRKGERILVDNYNMIDPDLHENPETFDIYRFIRLREQRSWTNKAQLVSASTEHLGFGYGHHACPGRFFAANEIKIVLCHLLLKYDWKLAPETDTSPFVMGLFRNVNPNVRLMVRRRKEELDLRCLKLV